MVLKFKSKDINEEKSFDGYSIISLSKKFQNKLMKNFNKKADKIYKQLYNNTKNQYSIIPSNYNPTEIKHQMEIEDALCNEGIVAMKFNMPIDDNNAVYNIENKFIKRNQKYMFCNNQDQQIILCPNNQESIENMKLVIENEIISMNDRKGIDVNFEECFGMKDIKEKELEIIKEEVQQQILLEEYLGDIKLANNLIISGYQLSKLFIDKKHHKEIEAMLLMLNINYIFCNNTFIISKNDLANIKQNISGLITGNISISSNSIYDIVHDVIISENKEIETQKNIDEILKSNKFDIEEEFNEHSVSINNQVHTL